VVVMTVSGQWVERMVVRAAFMQVGCIDYEISNVEGMVMVIRQ
jgi:hypothetical protein